MTYEEIFQHAWHAFEQAADDRPDNVPYYRDWAGIRAVIGKEALDRTQSIVHNAMFYATPAHTWQGIRNGIIILTERMELPREPHYTMLYDSRPTEDVDGMAKEIFGRQFKRAFPGKRLGTKFAHEQWAEVGDKARGMAREIIAKEMADFKRKEDAVNAENAKRHQAWVDECTSIESVRGWAASLPTPYAVKANSGRRRR
jgi:hypothetical protein